MNTLKTTQCPSSQVPAVQAPREYPLESGVRLRARVQAAVPVLQAAELPLGDLLHAAEGLPRRLHGDVRELGGAQVREPAVRDGEKQMRGSGGSLEPPGPLPTHLHTVHMEYSGRLPTRLSPLAERTCFSQVRDLHALRPLDGDAVESENDAKLARKLGQLQLVRAVFPQGCTGQRASFGPT